MDNLIAHYPQDEDQKPVRAEDLDVADHDSDGDTVMTDVPDRGCANDPTTQFKTCKRCKRRKYNTDFVPDPRSGEFRTMCEACRGKERQFTHNWQLKRRWRERYANSRVNFTKRLPEVLRRKIWDYTFDPKLVWATLHPKWQRDSQSQREEVWGGANTVGKYPVLDLTRAPGLKMPPPVALAICKESRKRAEEAHLRFQVVDREGMAKCCIYFHMGIDMLVLPPVAHDSDNNMWGLPLNFVPGTILHQGPGEQWAPPPRLPAPTTILDQAIFTDSTLLKRLVLQRDCLFLRRVGDRLRAHFRHGQFPRLPSIEANILNLFPALRDIWIFGQVPAKASYDPSNWLPQSSAPTPPYVSGMLNFTYHAATGDVFARRLYTSPQRRGDWRPKGVMIRVLKAHADAWENRPLIDAVQPGQDEAEDTTEFKTRVIWLEIVRGSHGGGGPFFGVGTAGSEAVPQTNLTIAQYYKIRVLWHEMARHIHQEAFLHH
jgi:hypothetical protein